MIMNTRVEIVLFHLTCPVGFNDDPVRMVAEDDQHAEIAKYTCPMCHHKVALDIEVVTPR